MSKNDKNDAIDVEGSKNLDLIALDLIAKEQKKLQIWKENRDLQTLDDWKAEFSYDPTTVLGMEYMLKIIEKEAELLTNGYLREQNTPQNMKKDVNKKLVFLKKKGSYIRDVINYKEYKRTQPEDEKKALEEIMETEDINKWITGFEKQLQETVKKADKILPREWYEHEFHKFWYIQIREEKKINTWLELLKKEIYVLKYDSNKNKNEIDALSQKMAMVNSYSKIFANTNRYKKIVTEEIEYRENEAREQRKHKIRQTDEWKNWKKNLDAKGGNIEKWKLEFDERIGLGSDDIYVVSDKSEGYKKALQEERYEARMIGACERPSDDKIAALYNDMYKFLSLRHLELDRMTYEYPFSLYSLEPLKKNCNMDQSPKKLEEIIQLNRERLLRYRKNIDFNDGITESIKSLFAIRKIRKFLDKKEKEIPFLKTSRTDEWKKWKQEFDKKDFDNWKQEFTKSNISDSEYPNKIQDEKHRIKTYRILLTREHSVLISEKKLSEESLEWHKTPYIWSDNTAKQYIKDYMNKSKGLNSIETLTETLEKLEKMEKFLKPSIFKRISDAVFAPFKKDKVSSNDKNTQNKVPSQTSEQQKENANVKEVAEQHKTQTIVSQLGSRHGVKDVTNTNQNTKQTTPRVSSENQAESQSHTKS